LTPRRSQFRFLKQSRCGLGILTRSCRACSVSLMHYYSGAVRRQQVVHTVPVEDGDNKAWPITSSIEYLVHTARRMHVTNPVMYHTKAVVARITAFCCPQVGPLSPYLDKLSIKSLSRRSSVLPAERICSMRHHQKISTVIEGTRTPDGVVRQDGCR
jgi:hypothetical protein